MSYSRWLNSIWYTFWCASSGDTKDEQVFYICDFRPSPQFTYKEIKEDIEDCIRRVVDVYSDTFYGHLLEDVVENEYGEREFKYKEVDYPAQEFTEAQLEELRGYMRQFVQDVEEEYGE
jgi:hypothetical protein